MEKAEKSKNEPGTELAEEPKKPAHEAKASAHGKRYGKAVNPGPPTVVLAHTRTARRGWEIRLGSVAAAWRIVSSQAVLSLSCGHGGRKGLSRPFWPPRA